MMTETVIHSEQPKWAKGSICVVLAASFMLSACAQMPKNWPDLAATSEPSTPGQVEMAKSTTDFGTTVAGGAAAGAAVGSLLGYAFGGTSGLIMGVASGLVAGSLAGYYVADQKEMYAKMEDKLDVLVADLQNQNTKLAQMVTSSETMLTEEKRSLEEINAQYQTGTATKEQVLARIQEANTSKALITKAMAQIDARRVKLIENNSKYRVENPKAAPDKVAAYDAEFAKFNQGRASLDQNLSSLDALVSSIKLEKS
jgi:outer membrane lipoprotein SlyB